MVSIDYLAFKCQRLIAEDVSGRCYLDVAEETAFFFVGEAFRIHKGQGVLRTAPLSYAYISFLTRKLTNKDERDQVGLCAGRAGRRSVLGLFTLRVRPSSID